MIDKASLRALKRGHTLDDAERLRQSQRIHERSLELAKSIRGDVALFVGVKHEPCTRGLFEQLAPRRCWLPRVVDPQRLEWVEVERWDALVPGRFAIPVPRGAGTSTIPETVGLVFVPGLAFDTRGGRLGHGAGYYDRALTQAPFAIRCGLGLEHALVEEVPEEDHDVRMDWVVVPSGTHCGENARAWSR